MTPIIYNSLDAGATKLNIAAGSLNAILKACLETGYGNKQAAGWNVVYENPVSNKIAISSTNIKSNKNVLLIDDSVASYATVTAYASWDTNSNTGITQFGSGYFVKQWNAGFTPNWVVVATDTFFYLFVQTESSSQTMRAMNGFGDAKSLRTDRVYSALLASSSTSYSQSATGYRSVQTNNGTANFPQSLFPKNSASTGWGDRSADDKVTNTQVLSDFVLYRQVLSSESQNEPACQLQGMLMPYSTLNWTKNENNLNLLLNQLPYVNPILGMYQPWHGRVWIHTDDWGF